MALTALQVKTAKPGRHTDGRGLYLVVKPTGARSWVLRVQADGRRHDYGLGPTDLVSLVEARAKAIEGRKIMRDGGNPSAEWKRKPSTIPTFEAAARQYVAKVKAGWTNSKHSDQWLTSLDRYAFPIIGPKLVDAIDVAAIQEVLHPIWLAVPETARRIRQRVGAVLDYAHAQGWRAAEAPIRAVSKGLPNQPKRDGHFAAMPYQDLPALLSKLRAEEGTPGRLALEFTILTAARSGETRGATWDEIDLDAKLWSIPKARMGKTKEPHTVPLSDAAVAVLMKAKDFSNGPTSIIFPGNGGKALSDMTVSKALRAAGATDTVHGMRSAFRDWCAEQMPSVPGDVAEAALSHKVRNKVEAAYRRTKFLDQRRDLMGAWAEFLAK
jgi:integrase